MYNKIFVVVLVIAWLMLGVAECPEHGSWQLIIKKYPWFNIHFSSPGGESYRDRNDFSAWEKFRAWEWRTFLPDSYVSC